MISGLDIGSRLVKSVILDDKHEIVSMNVTDTAAFYRNAGKIDISCGTKKLPLAAGITGYGKNMAEKSFFAGIYGEKVEIRIFPELKSHHAGAVSQTGLQDFVLLDIGGQDTKVILSEKGKMKDFETNDKCAASSGRFLENMAAVIGISDIGNYHENYMKLNSTCAVFGESELIGLLAEGINPEILAASVNYALFSRMKPMLLKFSGKGYPLVFCGGLAGNQALARFIRNELQMDVTVPSKPLYNGAIGAAVLAMK